MVSLVATAFGVGFSPFAPGTLGSLVGLPIAFFTRDWHWIERVGLWGGLIILGTWAAQAFDRLMQTHDNQSIVIDEVVGLGISAWTAGNDLKAWVAAFVLFRFFDILKPPPVRQVDQWSKNKSDWTGGFGVIADDVIAGLQALCLLILLQFFHILGE